jgi:hypothetical protein
VRQVRTVILELIKNAKSSAERRGIQKCEELYIKAHRRGEFSEKKTFTQVEQTMEWIYKEAGEYAMKHKTEEFSWWIAQNWIHPSGRKQAYNIAKIWPRFVELGSEDDQEDVQPDSSSMESENKEVLSCDEVSWDAPFSFGKFDEEKDARICKWLRGGTNDNHKGSSEPPKTTQRGKGICLPQGWKDDEEDASDDDESDEESNPAETAILTNNRSSYKEHRPMGSSGSRAIYDEVMETADQVIENMGGEIPAGTLQERTEIFEEIEKQVVKRIGGDLRHQNITRAYLKGYWFHSIGIHREIEYSVWTSPEREE